MANGFHSEVRFTHAADILIFHLKVMFLTYGMSVSHDISKQGIYGSRGLTGMCPKVFYLLIYYNIDLYL